MRILTLIFLFFGFNFSSAQTEPKGIIGTWELTITEGNEGKILDYELKNNKPDPLISEDTILTFEDAETIIIGIQGFVLNAKYTLKDALLTIGNRQFTIQKITKDELVFTEINDESGMLHTYKRI